MLRYFDAETSAIVDVAPMAPLAKRDFIFQLFKLDLPIVSERLAPAVTGANAIPIIPKPPLTAPNDPVVIRVLANSTLGT